MRGSLLGDDAPPQLPASGPAGQGEGVVDVGALCFSSSPRPFPHCAQHLPSQAGPHRLPGAHTQDRGCPPPPPRLGWPSPSSGRTPSSNLAREGARGWGRGEPLVPNPFLPESAGRAPSWPRGQVVLCPNLLLTESHVAYFFFLAFINHILIQPISSS